MRQSSHQQRLILLAVILLASLVGLTACSHSAITPETSELQVPADWQRGGDPGSVDLNWLATFNNPQLTSLVTDALQNNYLLEQERARLYQAEQAVIITRGDRLPTLDVSLDGSRRGFEGSGGESVTSQVFNADLTARWEVDLWGRLSKQQQAAQLALAAQTARLTAVERNLAATTASELFGVMEAVQLLEVARRRLDNTIESHDIVASGYRQGLNDALDLYLAIDQVERQRANVAQQRQDVAETMADLQLSLALYPDGQLDIKTELPVITDAIPAGLPSELLTRRPDIQEAWLDLMAADTDLAVAHKARFPSLTLSASGGVSTIEFADLLDGNATTWSIAGGLTQPLFDAGRLAALEEQALAQVRQTEQQYLDLVFRAFADVENAISRAASLRERYASFLIADSNAAAALALALEQYQRGLVPYTTVLESQRQAFDAEVTVVQLKNLLVQNRIALYLALGGEFTTEY